MFHTRLLKLAFVFAACSCALGVAEEVTLKSLLEEMVDRDRVASFPTVDFQCLQASSYHRDSHAPRGSEGWYADSDGVGFIRTEGEGKDTEWVIMEHEGPGCLTKFWTPFFYFNLKDHVGPTIRIYLDGDDDPIIKANFIELLTQGNYSEAPPKDNKFDVIKPFAGFTARAGDLYLPIPFGESCKITLDDKPFYNIINYRTYPANTDVETFSKFGFWRAKKVLTNVGKELTGPTAFAEGEALTLKETVASGAEATLALPDGGGAVRHLEITLGPDTYGQRLRSTVLRMTFDGQETVWTPVGDFFCSGNEINTLQMWEREVKADGTMLCRWVMPYQSTGEIAVENLGPDSVDVDLAVRVGDWDWDDQSMHFHARWRADDPVPGAPFQDWNFVDIQGRGVYVGDNWTVLCADTGWWGEGDEKIYLDDDYDTDKFPAHFGTGTEDYYGWAGGEVPTGDDVFSMPFLSNVRVGNPKNPRGYNICTRTRVLDAIPFHSRLRFDMEASFGVQMRDPWDLLQYSVVTYWYAVPGAQHNRPPQPEWASIPAMTVEELDARQDAIRERVKKRE